MAPNSMWLPKSAYLALNRKHVTSGARWAFEAGTDYWLIPGPDTSTAEDTGSQEQLPEWGWIATSLVDTAGAAASFMDSTDIAAPTHWLTDNTGDLLQSPAIFGDYPHARMAQDIAGMKILPKSLVCEFWGAMDTSSANEPRSGWGLFEDGGAAGTEADQLAFISSDSTNFQLATNGGAGALTDTGATDDDNWHFFGIELVLATGLVQWYIDDPARTTSQGSIAITGNEFPCKFAFHALSTNRPFLGITHIYYEW